MSVKYYYMFSDRQCKEKTLMNKINKDIAVTDKVLVNGNWQYYTARITESNVDNYLKRYSDAKVVLISDNARVL